MIKNYIPSIQYTYQPSIFFTHYQRKHLQYPSPTRSTTPHPQIQHPISLITTRPQRPPTPLHPKTTRLTFPTPKLQAIRLTFIKIGLVIRALSLISTPEREEQTTSKTETDNATGVGTDCSGDSGMLCGGVQAYQWEQVPDIGG